MTIRRRRQVRGIIADGVLSRSIPSRALWRSLRASSLFTGNYRIGCDTRKGRTQEEESRAITDRYGNGYYGGRSSRGVPPANIRDDVGGSARRRRLAIAKFPFVPRICYFRRHKVRIARIKCARNGGGKWARSAVGADATRRHQLRRR